MPVSRVLTSKAFIIVISSAFLLFLISAILDQPRIAFVLIGVIVFLIFFFRAKEGIFLYSFYLAFEETILQHIPGSFFLFVKYSGDMLLVLLLLAVFSKLAARRYHLGGIKGNPVNVPLLIFVGLALFSMIINGVPIFVGFAGLRQILRFIILYYVIIVIATSSPGWTPTTTKKLLQTFLIVVMCQVLLGYLQVVFGPGSALNHFLAPGKPIFFEGVPVGTSYSTADMRGLYGTFLTRNVYGLFMMSSVLYFLGLSHEVNDKKKKRLYFIGFILTVPCVFLSLSRQSILAALIGSILISIFKKNYKIATMLFISVVFFAVYARGYVKPVAYVQPEVGGVTMAERIASPFRSKYIEQSMKIARLAVMKKFAPRLFGSKYVFLGLGPGAFGTPVGTSLGYFGGYEKLGIDTGNLQVRKFIHLTADVGYLSLVAQYGVLGMAALMMVFVTLFRQLRKKYLHMNDPFFKGFLLGFVAYIVAFAVTWIAGLNIEIRQISYYFWLIAALLTAIPPYVTEEVYIEGET